MQFDLILTSPLIRAQQTATILKAVGLSPQMETTPLLAPEGAIAPWLDWFEQWREGNPSPNPRKLALVGHQPNLSHWAEMLVWGTSSGSILLKKAGVIGLFLPEAGNLLSN
ncbi:SixA phosphatase family protein, partial [Neosynechococcus sphagnicola]|uniref:SixA phosphatase family protein n=1 Tax=Neosynechococcus sphagnicola TaxID=1501145 RepID=UPI003B8343A5